MPMKIKIESLDEQKQRAIDDLLYIYDSKMYINEKGYLTKLVDTLYELDYYKDNETLFIR